MPVATIPTEPVQSIGSVADITSRREAVDSVLGTMAAEGDAPSAETLRDFERYVQGEIQLNELTSLIRRRALS